MGCECKRIKFNENISDNIFACPECGEIDPEISKINVDNKKIEFYCKKCAEKEFESKNFEQIEHRDCYNYYLKPDRNGKNQFWFKEYKNKNEQSSIVKTLLKQGRYKRLNRPCLITIYN